MYIMSATKHFQVQAKPIGVQANHLQVQANLPITKKAA
jgi:hypothetical protein